MSETVRRLNEAFSAPSYAEWHERVEKALRGRGDESALTTQTYDGIAIRPLDRRASLPAGDDPAGFPGFAPYLRGTRPAAAGWRIHQRHAHPDPEQANRQILKDLERGVGGVSLRIDPTGRCGTVVRSKADLARALEGVDMRLAPVVLDAGAHGPGAAALLLALWQEEAISGDAVQGHLGLDPLAALAATGRIAGDASAALAQLGALARLTAEAYPRVTAAAVHTRAYHSGGASEGQELGAMLAAGTAYLRAMEAKGLAPEQAAGQIAFTLMADADVVVTIAKLRAARALWARVLEACGVEDAPAMELTAETAPRMYTRVDPWSNILRATTAAFAAAVGGADAVAADPHDAALGPSSDFARRIARNLQLILAEESHIDQVIDPAGGAYPIERLTRDLAQAGWAEFQRIEGEGGLAASLESGKLQERIGAVRAERAEAAAHRREQVVGVSAYPSLEEPAEDPAEADLDAIAARAAQEVSAALPGSSAWPALIAAAQDGAAIEALTAALSEDTAADALPSWRPAEPFEALRAKSDTILARTGARPRVFLANLGEEAQYSARASWAANFLAAGGLAAVTGPGGTDAGEIARAFKESGCTEALICGPNDLYEERLAALAQALSEAGAGHVAVAGRPESRHEQAWREAGVDAFVYDGVDVVAALEAVYARMGEAA